jgi:hypothetical protein
VAGGAVVVVARLTGGAVVTVGAADAVVLVGAAVVVVPTVTAGVDEVAAAATWVVPVASDTPVGPPGTGNGVDLNWSSIVSPVTVAATAAKARRMACILPVNRRKEIAPIS